MKKVSDQDKLFYFERNFFTLDGFWMIVSEEFTDFDTALKIDLEVWQRLLKTIIKRIKRHLQIKSNDVQDIIDILSFRWSVEGWNYEIIEKNANEVMVKINYCPYKAILERSERRKETLPLICQGICTPLYNEAVKSFNSRIQVTMKKQMGFGGKNCEFLFKIT